MFTTTDTTTEAAAVFHTISKSRTVNGQRTRGTIHLVHDEATSQTWCGRKFRGVVHIGLAQDTTSVDCRACLTAYTRNQPRAWSRR